MRFVSMFNPVSLPEDPQSGQEGDLYYNSVEGNYKIKLNGVWSSLVHHENIKIIIAPEIFTVGYGSASAQVVLEQYHSENIINCVSASLTNVFIPDQSTTSIHVGSRMGVIRGGTGEVSITADPAVELLLPSEVYLTKTGKEGRLINIGVNQWIFDTEFPDLY